MEREGPGFPPTQPWRAKRAHTEGGCAGSRASGAVLCARVWGPGHARCYLHLTAPCEVRRRPSLCKTGMPPTPTPGSEKANLLLTVATSLTFKARVVLVFTLTGPAGSPGLPQVHTAFLPAARPVSLQPVRGWRSTGPGYAGPRDLRAALAACAAGSPVEDLSRSSVPLIVASPCLPQGGQSQRNLVCPLPPGHTLEILPQTLYSQVEQACSGWTSPGPA